MLLATELETLISNLGLTTLAIPIVHAIGGLIPSFFKQWFIPKREYSRRLIFIKEKLIEESCKCLAYTLDRALNSEEPIRGNGNEKPDLVNGYLRENYKLNIVGYTLERSYKKYSVFIGLLQIIAGVGVVLIAITLILTKLTSTLILIPLCLSVICIVLEFISICILINKVNLLENFEHEHLKT